MNYWIIVDDHHEGPYSAAQLVEAGLTADTLVWTEGLTDWTPAIEIAELAAMIENRSVHPQQHPEPEAAVEVESEVDAAVEQQSEVEQEVLAKEQNDECERPHSSGVDEKIVVEDFSENHREEVVNVYMEQPQQQCQPVAAVEVEPCPPSYIAWAIIVTLLCCTIVGIPAIILASMTKSAYYRGEIEKSKRYSEWSQWLIIASIVLGAMSWPFQICLMGMMQ